MNLEEMIRYETEGTCLDFKSEEYNSKNRDALIKDISLRNKNNCLLEHNFP